MKPLATQEEPIGDADESYYDEDYDDCTGCEEDVEVPAVIPNATPLQERNRFEFWVIIGGGSALSFNAGFVNGTSLQLGGILVSHVTGTTTKAGFDLGSGEFDGFAVCFALISCFVFGAAITGSMMPHSSFHLGAEYGPLFLIGSGLFMLGAFAIHFFPSTQLYFYFTAMACGLQNAMTTKYSGNIIRTTHMTGTATDVGLVFGRMMAGDFREMWKLALLLPMYTGFMLGAMCSVFAVRKIGKLTVVVNVLFFFFIGLMYSLVVAVQHKIPIWKAFLGMYARKVQTLILQQGGPKVRPRRVSTISSAQTRLSRRNSAATAGNLTPRIHSPRLEVVHEDQQLL